MEDVPGFFYGVQTAKRGFYFPGQNKTESPHMQCQDTRSLKKVNQGHIIQYLLNIMSAKAH